MARAHGRRLGQDHDHSGPGQGGATLAPESLNSVIYQGSSETVQAAINRAPAGETVILRAGTFNEGIDITTENIVVVGSGRGTLINGDDEDALEVNAPGVVVKNLAVQTTAGAGNAADALRVITGNEAELQSIYVEESDTNGIEVAADEVRIVSVWCDSANIDGSDIRLQSASENCIVDDFIGTVSDVGTGNSVGETA